MKLLLADDEVITRRGLVENIDWESLQIHRIIEASDGFEALELAKEHSPEIILTDIRMPRMDGVQLAFKVKEFLPDVCIIFMSGFSDKEYLQAAIQLKAVSYVEKPISNDEIASAVLEAVRLHTLLKGGRYSLQLQNREKISRLVLSLTNPPGPGNESAASPAAEMGLNFDEHTPFCTVLLKNIPMPHGGIILDPDEITDALHAGIHDMGFDFIYTLKYDSVSIFHLYGKPALRASDTEFFLSLLSAHLDGGKSWFISAGPIVNGVQNVYESYSRAVVLLQSSFFYDYGSVITDRVPQTDVDAAFLSETVRSFEAALSHGDAGTAAEAEETMWNMLRECQTLLPGSVRDIYFKLFISLEQAYHTQLLSGDSDTDAIWDRITACNTFGELHVMLREELEVLKERSETASGESAPVRLMKEYIHKNYQSSSLSVKEISENAELSVAYACTMFKNETGTTLNQYLTGYRMERARELLADPKIRISDVSSKVGYLDGNYFGKSFKKATGLTPSEYREKLLS